MTIPIEVTIRIKDEEACLSKRSLIYDPFILDPSQKPLLTLIEEAQADFKGNAKEADWQVKIRMSL